MAGNKKIAIVVDGYDIARIIPFNNTADSCEFKISFLCDSFEIEQYPLFSYRPINLSSANFGKYEVTYHRATETKPPKIHLKNPNASQPYLPLDITNLTDPSASILPLPLFEISVPDAQKKKRFKYNSNHIELSLRKSNVFSFFLTSNTFDLNKFQQEMPLFNFMILSFSFESFTTGTMITGTRRNKSFNQLPGIDQGMRHFKISDSLGMLLVYSFDAAIRIYNGKAILTVIDNLHSEAIMMYSSVLVNQQALLRSVKHSSPSSQRSFPESLSHGVLRDELLAPDAPYRHPQVGKLCAAAKTLEMGLLSTEESDKFRSLCIRRKNELKNALLIEEARLEKKEKAFYEKITDLVRRIYSLKNSIQDIADKDIVKWLKSFPKRSADNTILLITFLGLRRAEISFLEWEYRSVKYSHTWFADYDFDIDIAIHPRASIGGDSAYTPKIFKATLHPFYLIGTSFANGLTKKNFDDARITHYRYDQKVIDESEIKLRLGAKNELLCRIATMINENITR